ncbi:glutathione S-transferase [Astrocystis sublimbata]|nr:glutathione S-transferase [Astrocystis sublimbata]
MSQITLYYVKGGCSLSPHALLCHIGVPFQLVEMKWRADDDGLEAADGSFSKADYRKINPAGYVPALVVDGGEVITEHFAVVTMIALLSPDKAAGTALLGGDGMGRVRVTQWMAWLSDTLHSNGWGGFAHPKRYVEDRVDMYEVVKAKGWKTIEECHGIIEKRLGEGGATYAVGGQMTVVDIFLYVLWGWAKLFAGVDLGDRYPNFEKLVRHMESLDFIRKAVEDEGLKLHFG